MREEYKDFKKGDLLSYSLLKKIDLEMLQHLKICNRNDNERRHLLKLTACRWCRPLSSPWPGAAHYPDWLSLDIT